MLNLLLIYLFCFGVSWPFAVVEQIISIKWTSRAIIHRRRRRRWTWSWTFLRVINELWTGVREVKQTMHNQKTGLARLNFGARQWHRRQFRSCTVRPFCMTALSVSNMLAVARWPNCNCCLFVFIEFLHTRIVRASRLWPVHRGRVFIAGENKRTWQHLNCTWFAHVI